MISEEQLPDSNDKQNRISDKLDKRDDLYKNKTSFTTGNQAASKPHVFFRPEQRFSYSLEPTPLYMQKFVNKYCTE
jgi:hypothetical protein